MILNSKAGRMVRGFGTLQIIIQHLHERCEENYEKPIRVAASPTQIKADAYYH
jgi:hypothetical protein